MSSTNKPLTRLARSQVKSITMALLQRQNWKCPLCDSKINVAVQGHKSDYCLDHNHETGEVRAVLHRSCNSAEGKILNAAGRWGAKSVTYAAVIPYLETLLNYWKTHDGKGTGMMYPDHKTPEQKRDALNKKRREANAKKRMQDQLKANKAAKGA